MQRLIYVNRFGAELEMYKGGAYILEHIEGTGSTGRKIATIKSVVGQGEYTTGARREAREVEAKISIEGKGRADMYKKRVELCDILSLDKVFDDKQKLASKLIYQNDNGMYWTPAMLEDDIEFNKRLADYSTNIKLNFMCPSSYWYGMTQERVEISFGGGAFTLPFKFPISFGKRNFEVEAENKGSINTPVEISIHGQGETPSILNASTGKRIKLKSPVPVGYTLKINTDKNKLSVRLVDTEGVSVNAFGMLDPQEPVSEFVLKVGLNKIVYEHGAEAALSKIEIKWYTSHEGV